MESKDYRFILEGPHRRDVQTTLFYAIRDQWPDVRILKVGETEFLACRDANRSTDDDTIRILASTEEVSLLVGEPWRKMAEGLLDRLRPNISESQQT
jgi:hypothetical protein